VITKEIYLETLKKKYQADYTIAGTNFKIYLNQTVGVADHPNVIGSMDELVEKIVSAKEKLSIIKEYMEI